MERYFLGNNSGHGFFNCYDNELRALSRVILLKGGAGTGKSTLLKRVAAAAKKRGLDYELWYCSGDPKSLDGVYIKRLDAAVVDATSPHASGVDIPVVKDVIFDLANGLGADKLKDRRDEIEQLVKCKKARFKRAYQHLKCALCHLQSKLELEAQGVDDRGIRAYCCTLLKSPELLSGGGRERGVFSHAICPSGENAYFDHLRDKRILLVEGCEYARKIFFDTLKSLCSGAMLLLNPLEPQIVEGALLGDVAIVGDAGHLLSRVSERISLAHFQGSYDVDGAQEEESGRVLQTAFGVECLDAARKAHMALEDIFVPAMDFSVSDEIYEKIVKLILD